MDESPLNQILEHARGALADLHGIYAGDERIDNLVDSAEDELQLVIEIAESEITVQKKRVEFRAGLPVPSGLDTDSYVVDVTDAEADIQEMFALELSAGDAEQLFEALERPATPVEQLREALQKRLDRTD